MTRHSRLRSRTWLLPVAFVILAAGHGVILYLFSSHVALPASIVSGVIILVVVKHWGLLGPVSALLRRRKERSRAAPLADE
jgi:hypothetical protein